HPPALGLEAAFGPGHLQPACRGARRDVLGGIETGETAADDFIGPVALDPLATRIPADHVSLRVEHVDGVVGDTAEQERHLPRFVPRRSGGTAHRSPPKIARRYPG